MVRKIHLAGLFLCLLVPVCLFLLTPLPAQAVISSGGFAGSYSGNGGGGGSGPVEWYWTRNTAFGTGNAYAPGGFSIGNAGHYNGKGTPGGSQESHLAYSSSENGQLLNNQRGLLRENRASQNEVSLSVTNRLVKDRCSGSSGYARAQCPLWWNVRESTGFEDPVTWQHVLGARIFPKIVPSNSEQIAGFSMRIWRENPRENQFELIMERQLGSAGHSPTSNSLGALPSIYNWWFGGTGTSRAGKAVPALNKTVGGTFSLGSNHRVISAGMIGAGQPGTRANCQGLRASAKNYYRSGRAAYNVGDGENACYWEGNEMGPNPLDAGAMGLREIWGSGLWAERLANRVPADQFGPGVRVAGSVTAPVRAERSREAVFVSWKLPEPSTGGSARIRFRFRGAPGLFYAVQIVAVNSRGAIVPALRGSGPTADNFVYESGGLPNNVPDNLQYFKVFMNTPPPALPCRPCEPCRPCPGLPTTPDPHDLVFDPPSASVGLEAQPKVQVNEENQVQLSLSINDPNDIEVPSDGRALIPRSANLYHYTPQLDNSNGAAGVAYGNEFVLYRDSAGAEIAPQLITPAALPLNGIDSVALNSAHRDRFRAPLPAGIASAGLGSAQIARLAVKPELPLLSAAGLSGVDSEIAEFKMTWLRPTPARACSDDAWTGFPFVYPSGSARSGEPLDAADLPNWPVRPDRCPEGPGVREPLNVSDELIFASASWDSISPARLINIYSEPDSIGYVSNQWLRCNQLVNVDAAGVTNAISNSTDPSQAYRLGLSVLNSPAQRKRWIAPAGVALPGGETQLDRTVQNVISDGSPDPYQKMNSCENPMYALLSPGDIGNDWQKQAAEGTLAVVDNNPNKRVDGENAAAAQIRLNTNRPGIVSSIEALRVIDTAGPEPVQLETPETIAVASFARGQSPITINFCSEGAPLGTTVLRYNPTNGTFQNVSILSRDQVWAGDRNCAGYAAKWQWDRASLNSTKCSAYGRVFPQARWQSVGWGATETIDQAWSAALAPDNATPPSQSAVLKNWDGTRTGYQTYASAGELVGASSAAYFGDSPGSGSNRPRCSETYIQRNTVVGSANYNRLRTIIFNGFLLSGDWRIPGGTPTTGGENGAPDSGYGPGNSGERLKNGTYLIRANFAANAAEPGLITGLDYALGGTSGDATGNLSLPSGANGGTCPRFPTRTSGAGGGFFAAAARPRPRTCWSLQATYQGYDNRVIVSRPGQSVYSDTPSEYISVFGPRADR